MATITASLYRDSELGVETALPRAGSALEHPLVYDAIAREFLDMAQRGLVDIVHERKALVGGETLISELRFRKRG